MNSIDVQLKDILTEFMEDMNDDAEKAFKETGKDTVQDLKNTSPRGTGSKHYADGWTSKVQGKGMDTELIVYNRTMPGLTHLLENGHMMYDRHGINHGRTRAVRHIEPAQNRAIEDILTRLSK